MQKINGITWAILIISLSFTMIIWLGFSNNQTQSENQFFQDDANFMTLLIHDELDQYEQVLVGAKGLFAASDNVTLSEWRAFVETQDIETRFPGLQGVGYVQQTLHEDRAKLITEMKSYGFDAFDIKPAGDRGEYYPVLFLEPLNLRNQQAIGYDIYSEQTRKNTINTLIETGETTITGKITLVQEIDDDVQNGFLMLVPVYSNTNPDKLQGIVDAIFRINDFIQGTTNSKSFEHLKLKIYDNYVSEENLFFNSDTISDSQFSDPDFSTTMTTSINDRDWIFVYEGIQSPLEQIDDLIIFVIPIVGFSMSLLLFYTMRLFTNFTVKQEQYAKLKEVERQKHEFLSMITHELKTPLTPIMGWAEALTNPKMMGDITKKQKKAVDRIYSNAIKLNKLIGDVLDIQKLSLDKIGMENESFDLDVTIKSICKNHDLEFKRKNVRLENNCNTKIIIHGDVRRLEQVFNNIINNALDFISKDTGIVELNAKQEGGFIIFSIKDNGIGIPEEHQKQLFQKFYQINTSVTRQHGGTGLGLAICEGLVKKMGGEIWCESELGKETTFYFTIPIDRVDKKL
jgi:signal transduction histidine kinase